jgi:homoserine dehydrogenase
MSSTLGIALIGCGIVGGGVIDILTKASDVIAARTGQRFAVKHVVVRDTSKPRQVPAGARLGTDWRAAVSDPAVSIVVELMGGTTTAGEVIETALKLGKPVVTANKALLASRGPELFGLARSQKRCIGFEASCGGGIPIIDALQRGLAANRIDALIGIVNGTCNYILTRMTREGLAYADALKAAQEAGFAEADPTTDVAGRDAAQKLALLAGLAFGKHVRETDIHIEGIDTLDATDIHYSGELGYVIKLLAIAKRAGDRVSLRVHPTLVAKNDVLADVSGSFNAISVFGHAIGHALFYGRGAGAMPTASAVVADLISVGNSTCTLNFNQFRFFPDVVESVQAQPIDELESRYYLRLTALDQPGVMAQVTAALGRQGISLSAVLQRDNHDGRHVPIVITTHRANEGSMRKALAEIDTLNVVRPGTICIRMIDQPTEFAPA